MYIINQGSVTCIQWFAVIALSFQCLSFQDWRQCIAIHVYECDREMDIDSENDGLFCMLGSKPENNVSECNVSDHLLKCDLHSVF